MKPGTSLSLYFLTFFCFTSTYGEPVSKEYIKNEKNKKIFFEEDSFVKRPSSIVSLQSYTSAKANLQRQRACYPKCVAHKQQGRDHNYIRSHKHQDARMRLLVLHQRQLQRGSTHDSHHTSSSKYYNTIVYVCVGVLVFMILVCVGLRYYIGIPQDHFPEVTERKEVMKDMSKEDKRSVLEYIFKKQQIEEGDKNVDSPTDLDDTESIENEEIVDENIEESLNSMTSIENNNKNEVFNNEDSEKSVDTISTKSLTTAEDLDKAIHKEDICSICLDSFGENVEAGNVLYAPNCSHEFHKECIMEWFLSQSSNLTCPDCRSQMFTVDELRAAADALNGRKKDEEDLRSFRKKFICWWKV